MYETRKNEEKEEERLKRLILENGHLPRHIAITMDGNGRWARRQGKPRNYGHKRGAEVAQDIVKACHELGIEVLTLYAFSFENWQRSRREVSFLMEELLPKGLRKGLQELDETTIRVRVMGELDYLPEKTLRTIEEVVRKTEKNTGMVLNLAISYSGRLEILSAVRRLIDAIERGEIRKVGLDESLFSRYLYTAGLPDPDIHIRAGGVNRISNLMLWQMAYTELLAPGMLWPDFTRTDLYKAILHYQHQPRKFGRVPKADR